MFIRDILMDVFSNQRDTYKLVEKLTSGRFKSEISLLKSLVKHVVDYGEFEIIGGRIWEIDPTGKVYILRYQNGKVKKIPNDYQMSITDHPTFSELSEKRTVLQKETDRILLAKGIEVYSATGVGEIIKLRHGKYFKYALGFNAPKILQSFYETLSIISSVATIALRTLSSQAEQKKIQRDLHQASDIQKSLLPEHYLEFKDYKIFGVCTPDSEVGGDYFDYFKSAEGEDENIGIVVSDAASKGLPAAIQALFVSGAIRMGKAFSPRISQLLSHLNTLIFDTFPYERFVTLFYCELTTSKNRLVLYGNAGHCEPIHYRPTEDSFKKLGPTGGLLGIMRQQQFEVENIRMHSGDVLVLYTDGISEARTKTNTFYGEERICRLVKKHHKLSPDKIAYKILQDVQKFSIDSSYTDDRTLVVIKRD